MATEACVHFPPDQCFPTSRSTTQNNNHHDHHFGVSASTERLASWVLPRIRRRCIHRPQSMPLFVCLLIPAVFLSIFLTVAIWWTMYSTSMDSVDNLVFRLHHFVSQDLLARADSLLNEMGTIIDTWSALLSVWDCSMEDLNHQLVAMMHFLNTYSIALSLPNNTLLAVKRLPSGNLALGEYFPPPSNSSPQAFGNIVYWNVDSAGHRTTLVSNSSFHLASRPWYVSAMKNNRTLSAVTYRLVSDGVTVVGETMPLYDSNDRLRMILVLNFVGNTFQTSLSSAYQALQTTGLLVLLDANGEVLSSVTSSPNTLALDIAEAKLVPPAPKSEAAQIRHFATFGDSFVLRVSLCDEVGSSLCSFGFDWSIIAILPKRDYYAKFEWNNIVVGIITAAYFLAFVAIIFISSRLIIRRPLISLAGQIVALKEAVLHQDPVIHTPNRKKSMFSEILILEQAVVAALEAVESEMQQRAEAASILQRQRAEEEARGMLHEKDMFLATISHEMRTPLTACIGMAEILLETTKLDHRQHECAETISSNGSMLLSLVNDLLDYRKLEAGKLEIESVPFCPRECVERAARVVQTRAEDQGLELIIHIKANLPSQCIGDPSRLSQVLLNLLSNAVKFTPSGSVTLMCSLSEDQRRIHFSVIDTGIGLEPATIQRLFQPFVQADASMSRRYGGTGLGLVISKKLVELMNGSLEVHSAGTNQGCEFRFDIPCMLVNSTPSSARSMSSRSPVSMLSILVVDDLIPRRNATCEMLRALAIPFFCINSVSDLAETPEDSPMITNTSVVIIHPNPILSFEEMHVLQTKGKEGSTAARWIVAVINISYNQIDAPNVINTYKPLMLAKLSAAINASTTNSQGSKTALSLREEGNGSAGGCADEAWKRLELIVETPKHHGLRRPHQPTVDSMAGARRLLVVDDVIVNQRVLTLKLQQRGYTNVDLASSGLEALEAVQKAPFVYSCILMDVMMPGMDGLESTRRIKLDPRYASVPIIGVTGNCNTNDIQRCLEAGMAEVLAKPIDTGRLFNVLERYCMSSSSNGAKKP